MIFECPICGYPNSINSEFKCEACGNVIEDMQNFYEVDSYLKELENKYPEKLVLEPRLARIYFSDYNSPIFKEFKEKYQLDTAILNFRLDFLLGLYEFVSNKKYKELVNILFKYDKDLLKFFSIHSIKDYYYLLDKGRGYLSYDNYKRLIENFAKSIAKELGIKDADVFIVIYNEKSKTLGASISKNSFELSANYILEVFKQNESPLNLIFTIAHELCHCYIKKCLLNGTIDENIAYNMEHCMEEACRRLCLKYGYDNIYKKDNYTLNFEENTANFFAFRHVNNLVRNLGSMISEKDKNRYLNTEYMNTVERYGKVNGIFNSKLGIPKFIEDFELYENANKDESVKLNGENFLKNNRNIVYTHELLDTMIQENPDILEVKMFKLLNIIYINDNGAVRRKTAEELQNDLSKTDNPYLKEYLAGEIKNLEEVKASYKK